MVLLYGSLVSSEQPTLHETGYAVYAPAGRVVASSSKHRGWRPCRHADSVPLPHLDDTPLQWKIFSFIESAEIIRETRDGRMEELEITLSDWVFNAIQARGGDLLTISRDYFRLRKPIERRLYEIARKCCGQNAEWKFRVETLHEKTGSRSTLPEFRRMLTTIIDENGLHGHIPDYTFELVDGTIYIRPKPEFTKTYQHRPGLRTAVDIEIDDITLRAQTYETARRFAGGWDLYGVLEPEWRAMLKNKQTIPHKPDGSFVGFVKWYVKQHGTAAGHCEYL